MITDHQYSKEKLITDQLFFTVLVGVFVLDTWKALMELEDDNHIQTEIVMSCSTESRDSSNHKIASYLMKYVFMQKNMFMCS